MCHIPVKVTKGKGDFTMKERFMENGIEYVRCGKYYIPNLMVPELPFTADFMPKSF